MTKRHELEEKKGTFVTFLFLGLLFTLFSQHYLNLKISAPDLALEIN